MNRRKYLQYLGLAGAAGTIAGCSDDDDPTATQTDTSTDTATTTDTDTPTQTEVEETDMADDTAEERTFELDSVYAPDRISPEEPFAIDVLVENVSEDPAEAVLAVTRGDATLASVQQTIPPAEQATITAEYAFPTDTPLGETTLQLALADQTRTIPVTVEQRSADSQWPTAGHDFQNTGSIPTDRGPMASPAAEWGMYTGGLTWPTATDNQLYVAGSDGTVRAFNLSDQTQLWEQSTQGAAPNRRPTVSADTVFVGTYPIYALNTTTGAVRWTNDEFAARSRLLYADGKVFFGDNSSNITALDAATGEVVWQHEVELPADRIGRIAGGTLFMGDSDNNLYALDTETGEEQWNLALEGPGLGVAIPIIADNTVYVGNDGARLYAVDAASGDVQWKQTGPIRSIVNQVQVDDEYVYAAGRNPRIQTEGTLGGDIGVFSRDTGELQWRTQIQHDIFANPILQDGTLFVGHDGGMTAYEAATGEERWNVELPNRVRGLSQQGTTIYLGCWDGFVYAVSMSDGSQQWQSPRFLASASNATPAVADGTAVVGSLNANVYAVDATSGDRQWQFKTEEGIQAPATIHDGVAYCCSAKVFALDLADAEVLWRDRIIGGLQAAPVVRGDDVIAVGQFFGIVRSYTRQTGAENWTTQVEESIPGTPAVINDSLFFGTDSGALYALAADDGTVNWKQTLGVSRGSPAVTETTGYIGTEAGEVLAFSTTSGEVQWMESIGPRVATSPAIADEAVFASASLPVNDAGSVTKLNAVTGDIEWTADVGANSYSDLAVDQEFVYAVGQGDLIALDRTDGTQRWRHSIGSPPIRSSPAVVNGRVVIFDGTGQLQSVWAR